MKRPICVKCQLIMTIKKTGADIELMMDSERPYQIWNADIYECNSCGMEVVSGFGDKPVAEQYQKDRYAKFRQLVSLRFWECAEDRERPPC